MNSVMFGRKVDVFGCCYLNLTDRIRVCLFVVSGMFLNRLNDSMDLIEFGKASNYGFSCLTSLGRWPYIPLCHII